MDMNPLKAEPKKWQWQEAGTAWKGVGVYHVTLTVPSREPLFGTLMIPENDPSKAWIERTALGNAVVDELYVMCRHYPVIRILQFCLMPDHLHAVVHVTQVMDTSIRSVIRGYWQGVKKLGRAYTLSVAAESNPATMNEEGAGGSAESNPATMNEEGDGGAAELNPATMNEGGAGGSAELNSATMNEGDSGTTMNEEDSGATMNEGDSGATMNEGGYPFPIFTERPFIRPLSRRGQLHTMIHYVQMNPLRLATKRLKPGYFRVQNDVGIGGRMYDAVGNVALLMEDAYAPVHVRHTLVEKAKHGDDQELRDYKNACVLKARKAEVMVSPFISPDEKQVMQILLQEHRPFVLLTDNGFRDYYKPAGILFDACAAGRLLILSPWPYDGGKRHISRADCVALNAMAEEICNCLNGDRSVTAM